MLTSQQFCVKWNSYSSNLQSVFPRLLNSEHFVDITLACEGQMIKCHKVVLSACSTYFEKLLVQNPCQHPIIFMKDMKHWEVQALVDFMYKGEVNVSQEELNSLLVAAEALQIRGLCGSDTSSNQQDGNKPVLPLSKLPSVTLPNDIVLSGGTSAGQESYQKKRKLSSDEKEQLSTLMPRITGVTSVNTNQTSSDSTATHPTSATDQSKDDGTTEEGDDDMNVSKIKQEMEIEDHFISGEGDIDVQEEDAGNEQQEDSDSNNREDVHSNAHLDQPGPSGIATATNPGEKASTVEFAWLPKVRPYRQYSNDNLWAALMDVKQGGSVYRASKEHGIPRKTLRNWMKRWNIKSVYSPPVRRSMPPIVEASEGGEISKGSGVTLTPVIPKLMSQNQPYLDNRCNLGTFTFGSGVTIAPSVSSFQGSSHGRLRQNSRWLPGCELETNSGIVISPAMPPALYLKSERNPQLTKLSRK